ncbi:MAG TPA: class I SAM-dependent methyltransferase, partial [Allosphingosinicella sp.]|nr:class I SAM-dependent methyltransferase [Allosphingosinicella sp.]
MLQRGKHVVAADRGFATGGGLVARLFGGSLRTILDRIDAGLAEGRIDLTLPDGSFRALGGRAEGPVAIVHLRSWRALVRLGVSGSVGWYKAWARGEWASPDPVPLFDLFMRNAGPLGDTARAKGPWRALNWLGHRLRANSRARARANIAHHYDLGNDFYAAWLDAGMTYSSAIFSAPGEALEAAQENKIRLLLDRLDLQPGDRLLEIGCGWGGLAEIAVRDYGVHVTGLTLSAEQKAY